MQAVNIKELKAKLSGYIRQVRSGETFLVTDRNQVVARLCPIELETERVGALGVAAKLAALGARPPLRDPRPTDYQRVGGPSGLASAQIDALLDFARGEPGGTGSR